MINKKIIFNISISILSVLIGITLSEFLAKKLGLGNPILYNSDPLVGYRLKPNQSKLRRANSLVTSDSEGFRINPSVELPKNNNYLVFVGDSVTYGGSYIDNSELFSSKFCELLNNEFYCLNNGLNAWGVLNMGRFISNFGIYSRKRPSAFILVILPGDEARNIKSLSDTPFWDNPPKEPSALNEIIRFFTKRYFLPNLKNKKDITNDLQTLEKNRIKKIQRNTICNELEILLKKSKYPINIVITPPKKWFEDNSKQKEIKIYDKYLKEISKLKVINNTCNLYDYIQFEYDEGLYVDGVHLSKKGHKMWAKKLKECLNY